MFAKLLKHDLRAVFKYWWIGAVAMLGIAVFGGFSSRLSDAQTKYQSIQNLGIYGMLFSYIAIYLMPLFVQIILLIRYYKHFFSDEGYLTFTLPVKKTSLLDSKLLTGFIYMLSSYVLMFAGFTIMEFIAYYGYFDIWEVADITFLLSIFDFNSIFGEGLSNLGGYAVPSVILFILSVIVYIFLFNAFIYACMTLAASITKKHKVLVGIALYAGIRVFIFAVTRSIFVSTVFYSYSVPSLTSAFESPAAVFYLLLGALGVLLAVFGALYYLITVILHKKLNLV